MTEDLINCKHEGKRGFAFIQSAGFSGDGGSGRDVAHICLTCGTIRISGDRDFKHFEVTLHITIPEQAAAVSRWVEYVSGEETREERIARSIEKIRKWRDEAYPLDIFPEPDLARSGEVLEAAGLSIDRISASNMRFALSRVCEILEEEGLLDVSNKRET